MAPHDRRASERYLSGTVIRFSCPLAGEAVTCKGLADNVSAGGIGLKFWSFGWFSPGDPLAIGLPRAEPGRPAVRAARVANVRWDGDGWLLGCEFLEPLTTDELEEMTSGELVGSR